MKKQINKAVFFSLLTATLVGGTVAVGYANISTGIQETAEKTVDVGVAIQKSHESWVDEERDLMTELEGLEEKIEQTQWQVGKILSYQQSVRDKIAELEIKAAAMEEVNLQLLPLLEKNLAQLEESVAGDMPVNFVERKRALLHAQETLNDYDAGLLDKARVVLDAVVGEVLLGHKVTVNERDIDVAGTVLRVKELQVGRLGLYAATLDNARGFYWKRDTGLWTELEEGRKGLGEAIEVAEGIRLVEINALPVTTEIEAAHAAQTGEK